jgi:hypothetical protein
MSLRLKQTSIVGEGGLIEVAFPELQPGETVVVQVERASDHKAVQPPASGETREMGFLAGQIQLSEDFDAPLDDFADYTE